MTTKRDFHISDILSVTTGRLVSTRHMNGVYEVLNFLHQDNLFTHQLPRASREAEPWLRETVPQLYGEEMDARVSGLDEVLKNCNERKEREDACSNFWKMLALKFGEKIELSPIPHANELHRNALSELEEMAPGRVLPIVLE